MEGLVVESCETDGVVWSGSMERKEGEERRDRNSQNEGTAGIK